MAAEAGTGIRPLGAADPREVGPYRLTGRLGSGGMGSVFAGIDQFDRRVAVKIVHAQFADDHEFRARFTREVAMLRRVGGTCTTPVLDADTEATQPWFACEYVPGPTLQERVERGGPMSGDELFALAAGLAEALVALHGVGIVHRDLKPQNVVCSPAGPRVLDLGIARSMEDSGLTRTGMMIGSPAWMSPERFRGHNSTPAADVYAWAMMVTYAATGVIPFGTGAPEVVALRVLQEEADTSGVPYALRGVVEDSAAKDPLHRPSAHDVLATVTGSWRGALGAAAAPQADPVSDATSLIHMHWKGPAEDGSWGGSGGSGGSGAPAWAGPASGAYAPPGNAPEQSSQYAPAPGPQPSGRHAGAPYTASAPVPPPPTPDSVPSAGYPAYGAGAYGASGSVPAQRHSDTVVGDPLSGMAQAPPAGGRRRAGSAGGGRRGRMPVIAAVVVVAVIAGVVAVVLATQGGEKKKETPPTAAPPAEPPPGAVQGPGTYNVQGMSFQVPAGWQARPISNTSVCVVPVAVPVEQRNDCLRSGLRVWVGASPDRKVALTDPDGWTLGAPVACPGAAPAAVKPQGHVGSTSYPKIGDWTYEYAQYTVTCADGTKIEPQLWWLPKSQILFGTGALPKSYDAVVKDIIRGMDKSNYTSP